MNRNPAYSAILTTTERPTPHNLTFAMSLIPLFTPQHIIAPTTVVHSLYGIISMVMCFATQLPAVAQVADTQQTPAQQEQSQLVVSGRDLQRYEKKIKPLLMTACFDCHSADNVEGNFHADQLDPDFVNGKDITWWLEVYSVISKEEMPPPESSELTDADRATIVSWLSSEIQAAEKMRKGGHQRSSFRRLTRYEYNYTLQDLLGVPWTFSGDLPDESSEEGLFDNNAESLHMSVKQIETYQQLAMKALQRITVRGEQPAMQYWSIGMKSAYDKRRKYENKKFELARKKHHDDPESRDKDIRNLENEFRTPADRSHYLNLSTDERASAYWHHRKAANPWLHSKAYTPMPEPGKHFAVVQPGGRQAVTIALDDSLPDEGTMRVRIRASRARDAGQRVPELQLSFGFKSTDQGSFVTRVGEQDVRIEASFDQPEVYQWDIPLSEIAHRNPYRGKSKPGGSPNSSEFIRFTNRSLTNDDSGSSSILIEHVEVSSPFYEQWPPASHRDIFIESENSKDEFAYAGEIISAFMTRAWRRTPTADELDRKLQLFNRLRPDDQDFSQTIVEVLATILTSPKFLYVLPGEQQTTQSSVDDGLAKARLSQNELATRLSLFLWCSLPDRTLLELAAADRLQDPNILRQQVHRMLSDPRSKRFHQHFVQQWLKLQPLEFLTPSQGNDGLDSALLASMKREPIALFADMVQHDSSVLEFIDSNYLVVNERLATHYGIAGVQGSHFRRVALPDKRRRGGFLTQAGMLTMNSDGEHSHPVKRGVWLLTNLLNDPPPPPPAAVPEIDLTDPEILKLTLKQRIERHRDHAACLSCHQKIDPWGIAFENYDTQGRWRDNIDGQAVDATSELSGKVTLEGVTGLKQYLVQNRSDQFVRATVEKMASFALGRQLDFGDRAAVTQVTRQVRESGDGIRNLIFLLVASELFQAN